MPRPFNCRRVEGTPLVAEYNPAPGVALPAAAVILALDEYEALRLADWEGLYQEQAARLMAVSRTTFSRIVESARRKMAQALVEGRAIRIEGGQVHRGVLEQQACTRCSRRGWGGMAEAEVAGCQGRRRHRNSPPLTPCD